MNNSNESKPFMDSVFGKALIGIGTAIVMLVLYAGWVNSGANENGIFGLTFQYPLETKDHYCWRKSNHSFIIISSTSQQEYQQCLRDK